jgi:hypothetical protein
VLFETTICNAQKRIASDSAFATPYICLTAKKEDKESLYSGQKVHSMACSLDEKATLYHLNQSLRRLIKGSKSTLLRRVLLFLVFCDIGAYAIFLHSA